MISWGLREYAAWSLGKASWFSGIAEVTLSLATLVCMYARALGKQINRDGLALRTFHVPPRS